MDVHCHCLPNIDDGPASLVEAIDLCEGLVADGIRTVVATPHQLGRFDGQASAAGIRGAVNILRHLLDDSGISLEVLPGADVRIDERLVRLLASDEVLTLADGGRYILLELPYEVWVTPAPLLAELAEHGVRPILSHPERYPLLVMDQSAVLDWAPYDLSIQITAGSLVGDFGKSVERAAWAFLEMPVPVLVATDAHNMRGRRPRMTRAFERIRRRRGAAVARTVCIENPSRLVAGERLLSPAGLDAEEVRR